jgi:hypothetical protein
VADQLTVINVMRARYTRRGIAPEGLIADILFPLDRPVADDFEVTWLAYPKGESLTSQTLSTIVRLQPLDRLDDIPDSEAMADACLSTWYEDPI